MSIRSFYRAALGAVFAVSASFAQAGLLGTTVMQCTDSAYEGTVVTTDSAQCSAGNAQASPVSATVAAGAEFNISGNRFFDFDDTTLTINFIQPVGSPSPDLIIFTFSDFIRGITLVGANPLDVSWVFADNRAGFLISSPLVNGTATFRIDTNEVPEPSSVLLVGLGLFALARRRRCGAVLLSKAA